MDCTSAKLNSSSPHACTQSSVEDRTFASCCRVAQYDNSGISDIFSRTDKCGNTVGNSGASDEDSDRSNNCARPERCDRGDCISLTLALPVAPLGDSVSIRFRDDHADDGGRGVKQPLERSDVKKRRPYTGDSNGDSSPRSIKSFAVVVAGRGEECVDMALSGDRMDSRDRGNIGGDSELDTLGGRALRSNILITRNTRFRMTLRMREVGTGSEEGASSSIVSRDTSASDNSLPE